MYTGRCVERIEKTRAGKGLLESLRERMTILGGDVLVLAGILWARRPVEIFLNPKEIATITGFRRVRVTCLLGRAWVTAEGDWNDYDLGPGATVVLGGSGKIAVTGFGSATRIKLSR